MCRFLFLNFTQNSMNILRIICALASILFVMSDTMIAIHKFYTPISNSSVGISKKKQKIRTAKQSLVGTEIYAGKGETI